MPQIALTKDNTESHNRPHRKEAMMKTIGMFVAFTVLLFVSQSNYADAANVSDDLLASIRSGDTERVGQLLAAGADPNARIEGGVTALIAAAFEGNAEIVQLLLTKGADVNAKTEKGITALMIAAGKGYQDVVKLLLAKGADANIRESAGLNAFQLALAAGHQDVADLLKPHTKVTAAPTTKTVVGSLEKGQKCLPVMNFPHETMKKLKCLREGEEIVPTGVYTNSNWSLIEKPVMGWVAGDKLKEVIVSAEPAKPEAKQPASRGGTSQEFSDYRPSSSPERTERSPEETLSTGGGGGSGEWWRGR
jgi:hypothetical protein